MRYAKDIDKDKDATYRYLNFDQVAEYAQAAAGAELPVLG